MESSSSIRLPLKKNSRGEEENNIYTSDIHTSAGENPANDPQPLDVEKEETKSKHHDGGNRASNGKSHKPFERKASPHVPFEDRRSKKKTPFEREEWSSSLAFIFNSIGYVVGLGNIWRFPRLVFKNGGGSFLIAYVVMVVFLGIPCYILKHSIGQFTSETLIGCWEFCPAIKGLGYGLTYCSFVIVIYYSVILSWTLLYLFKSSINQMDWAQCSSSSSYHCFSKVEQLNKSECVSRNGIPCEKSSPCNYNEACFGAFGTCQLRNRSAQSHHVTVWNISLAFESGCAMHDTALEYFHNHLTGEDRGHDVTYLGPIQQELAVSLFITWCVIAVCLQSGKKLSERITFATATIQYVILLLFLFRGFFLQGSSKGISYLFKPQFEFLFGIHVWEAAALQVIFSLGLGQGGLVLVAHHNNFRDKYFFRHVMFIILFDSFISLVCGLVIFSFLGHLSEKTGLNIDQLLDADGPHLIFGVFLSSLTKLSSPKIFHISFFLMLLLMGTDSTFVMIEIIFDLVIEHIPRLIRHKRVVLLCLCSLCFALAVPLITLGGFMLVFIFDYYIVNWNCLLMAIIELVAVGWVYTSRPLTNDIEMMLCRKMNVGIKYYLIVCWKFISPCLVTCIVILMWMNFRHLEGIPDVAALAGVIITTTTIIIILISAVRTILTSPGSGFDKAKNALIPTEYWGPMRVDRKTKLASYLNEYKRNSNGKSRSTSNLEGKPMHRFLHSF